MYTHQDHLNAAKIQVFEMATSTPGEVITAFVNGGGKSSVNCLVVADNDGQRLWVRAFKKPSQFKKVWKAHLLAERVNGGVIVYPLPYQPDDWKWMSTGISEAKEWPDGTRELMGALKISLHRSGILCHEHQESYAAK
jgi:hypothetical protein